jgi:acetyltransferase-like isoleucine patch superfamily enzyme
VRGYVGNPLKRVILRGRLTRPYWRRRFHHFGEQSILHKPAWVSAPELISIGDYFLALHDLWLAVEQPARTSAAPVIVIGDNVAIRPHVTITAAESVVIEDHVVLSAFVSVVDSDHTFGRNPSVLYNPLVTAPIRVGRGTWVAERVSVLRGSNIGEHCVIGANSVVRGEIPDYSVAVGAPARVVGSTREALGV